MCITLLEMRINFSFPWGFQNVTQNRKISVIFDKKLKLKFPLKERNILP